MDVVEPSTPSGYLTQRDLVKLGAIVKAHCELWAVEADVTERRTAAKKALGSIWVIASGLVGFAVVRIGYLKDDTWLFVMGLVTLYFVASQTIRAWGVERDVRHEFADVRSRLWQMKYQWLSLGGTEDHLGAIYSIWMVDPGFESESYKEGWQKIQADIAERLTSKDMNLNS